MKYSAKSLVVIVLALVMGVISVSAQQTSDSLTVYFRQGQSVYEHAFRGNASKVNNFVAKIQLSQDLSGLKIWRVGRSDNASVEFASDSNEKLAAARTSAVVDVLSDKLSFGGTLFSLPLDRQTLVKFVKQDKAVPARKQALKVIQSGEPEWEEQLRNLNEGKTWNYLMRTQLTDLRSFRVFIYSDADDLQADAVVEVELASIPESMVAKQVQAKPVKQPVVSNVQQPVAQQKPVVKETPKTESVNVKPGKTAAELPKTASKAAAATVATATAATATSATATAAATTTAATNAVKEAAKVAKSAEKSAKAASETVKAVAVEPAKKSTESVKAKTADVAVTMPSVQHKPQQKSDWSRKLTIKTNLIGDAFLMANLALEIDIIKNLSFALPVYWSGWDYAGIHTLKFRTFMIQPEFRYYIPKTNGLYVGAHFGVGHWNFALGDHAPMLGLDDLDGWRYQDHKGESPAIGGGLSLGYALQFKKNPNWGMEFAIGGGVYDAKYDVFYNEENGPYHERGARTTYIGVDNVSVSFTYKFDLRRSAKNEKEGSR